MTSRTFLLLTAFVAAVAAGACEQKKSANPLSPSVAGPIPGVAITAPKLVAPTPGTQIETEAQPVTLVLENANSNGQRPLSYLFEVAMDADFSNKVLSREGITPGGNGRTEFKLPEALAAERTYYWRARAQDGANTGPYTSGVHFSIYTPIVLQAPQLASPTNDTRISDRNPTLVVSNAARSGPVGQIVYEFQVSADQAFSQVVGVVEQAEQAGSTRRSLGFDLSYDTRYAWRARAWETTKNMPGHWSATTTFNTALAPPPKPTPTPTPTPGSGSAGHVTGPLNAGTAEQIVRGTFDEFPSLHAVFGSQEEAESAAEQLLLRTIWHLKLAGFQAGRQKNPSGAISKDKLTIFIDGAWRVYDIYSLGVAGRATTVQFFEITGANHVPDPGIPD
jgi:hypothetical protein